MIWSSALITQAFWSATYRPSMNDPEVQIAWSVATPVLAQKDQGYPKIRDLPLEQLPIYKRGKVP